jgi:hypothetical protein
MGGTLLTGLDPRRRAVGRDNQLPIRLPICRRCEMSRWIFGITIGGEASQSVKPSVMPATL